MINGDNRKIFWLTLLLLISRLPFLFDGYGAEEDAWAMPLVAERIATTGVYEVSRLPGHPVQELTYALMWNAGPVAYNFVTLLLSTIGILFFMLALRNFGVRNYLIAGAALAFTPIVYINSTNALDYTWAMSFILISFWGLSKRLTLLAAGFIALAVGCRITTGAMLIPFAYLLWNTSLPQEKLKTVITFSIAVLIGSLVVFTPVMLTYGIDFFTYYEHFPIPGFAKNFYKGTIAVWGVPGCIALLLVVFFLITQQNKITEHSSTIYRKALLNTSLIVIGLYTISFIKVPLKSAFMIPLVPFVWICTSLLLDEKKQKMLLATFVISCFLVGINLSDPLRGSKETAFTLHASISGQPIALDAFAGPVTADLTKRQQRTTYAKSVLSITQNISERTFIIAGWWLADLLVLQRGTENENVLFRYYTDEKELQWYRQQGYRIYFLPEQDTYNDLRFHKKFTGQYATILRTEITSGN
ncbi:hypothetical protein BH11BAC2_BH11BAC2_08860 [soil metagenome]